MKLYEVNPTQTATEEKNLVTRNVEEKGLK